MTSCQRFHKCLPEISVICILWRDVQFFFFLMCRFLPLPRACMDSDSEVASRLLSRSSFVENPTLIQNKKNVLIYTTYHLQRLITFDHPINFTQLSRASPTILEKLTSQELSLATKLLNILGGKKYHVLQEFLINIVQPPDTRDGKLCAGEYIFL
jgi:hypothetical protein